MEERWTCFKEAISTFLEKSIFLLNNVTYFACDALDFTKKDWDDVMESQISKYSSLCQGALLKQVIAQGNSRQYY